MSDSLYATQVAIKTALLADATFTASVGTRVYDRVPPDAVMPYVTIGESTAVPFDVKDKTGMDQTLTLHVWSGYQGRKQVKDIGAAIYGVLNRGTLSISGHTFVDCLFEFGDSFEDADGLARHGVYRYRVTTQQSGA
ncbi:Tail completion protein [uncultured Caudovirales phage]|uniref:Tail completion protein n=1 Tax=uncultured Caudovirales phage TaxID=2100421 RepID=A0A6J5T6S9_9CAUD|nr:Tail completion protein [uncultured Caudovirales phage]CAB4210811.1 Tail completion protein [uncultured Caudovirales phage]CAB4223330.1 Tail completion protein [uncultured Caudovirales phage]